MPILRNLTASVDLSSSVSRVTAPFDRLVGWLGTARISAQEGKWIQPCSAIHTLGMRTHIDVIFLDHDSRVVGLCPNVSPNQLYISHRRAKSIIEMGRGFLDHASIAVGDHLALINDYAPLKGATRVIDIGKLMACERGATLVEYALVIALIAMVVFGVALQFGVALSGMYQRIASALSGA